MKAFVLVNKGMENLASQELAELIGVKGKKVGRGVVEFSAEKEELVKLCSRGQSFRKVLVKLGLAEELRKIELSKVKWKEFVFKDCLFRVEILGVKGNEKRMEMSKEISRKIFELVKQELGFEPAFDFRIPDVKLIIYFDGKKYFVGIDLGGYELNKRTYRVFVHSASIKGDMAYYLLRKSGFVKKEKLAVGLVKDGVLAIEAGLFVSGKPVNRKKFAFEEMPGFKKVETGGGMERGKRPRGEERTKKILGFDSSGRNVRAAKKNAQIAGAKDELQIVKMGIDELDVRFKEGELDRLIFLVTKKDENKLNEIYHQAAYVLRKKGTLLLVGREGWEVSVPASFKLAAAEVLKKGESRWKVWMMEKR